MTIQLKTRNLESKLALPIQSTNKLERVGTLRRRLLISILPAVLIPFAIASAIGYGITKRQAEERIFERFEEDAVEASATIAMFIRNSFQAVDLIASNPEVIEAAKAGSQNVRERELLARPLLQLEQEFADTKLLASNDSLNNYLEQITKSDHIAEILVTERNGFNVAYSNQTSDFIQSDEAWWRITQEQELMMDEPDFDESANATVISFSREIREPQTGEFLGVVKAAIPTASLSLDLSSLYDTKKNQSERLLVIDPDDSFVIYSSGEQKMEAAVDHDDGEHDEPKGMSENADMFGDELIVKTVETLVKVEGNSLSLETEVEGSETNLSLETARESIAQLPGFAEVSLRQEEIFSEISTIASFVYQNQIYTLSTVPQTDFVTIHIVDYELIATTAKISLTVYAITAIVLAAISIGIIFLLAQQITQPLTNLSATTQKVAGGDLDVRAELEGTLETRTLANNFNILVKQVTESLRLQQTIAREQLQEKEQLEQAIYTLIEEVADATDGDLTVRANLDSIELSTVADLFNAIIDNLQEIALEAKQSSSQVGSSLKRNEAEIRTLARQALAEAKETHNTLKSVAQMSQSIQTVAANASQVEQIADDTYNTVLSSTKDMDSTVDSIAGLRTTVGETSKKMKRLAESSQKISRAVSFIEEIALKTNILAINATVEAGRAGEYGQGFSIVAEQVAELAEQSAAATKEITQIVGEIQSETQIVNQAMESGTTQVVETTHLIESSKESLKLVLEKSQTINQLMEEISQSTVSQADTSRNVTNLMQKIAQLSKVTSQSSEKVARSIVETAKIAQKLESAVAQFKVAKSSQSER